MLIHGVAPSGLLLSTMIPVPKYKRASKSDYIMVTYPIVIGGEEGGGYKSMFKHWGDIFLIRGGIVIHPACVVVYINPYTHTYTYAHKHIHIHPHTYMRIYTYTYIYTHITHLYTHPYIRIHT